MDDLFVISSISLMLSERKEIFGEKAMEFAGKVDATLGGGAVYKVYILRYNGEMVVALTNLVKGCPVIINREYKHSSGAGFSSDFNLPETYTADLEDFISKDKVKTLIEEYGF